MKTIKLPLLLLLVMLASTLGSAQTPRFGTPSNEWRLLKNSVGTTIDSVQVFDYPTTLPTIIAQTINCHRPAGEAIAQKTSLMRINLAKPSTGYTRKPFVIYRTDINNPFTAQFYKSGYCTERITIWDELPEGTYYYIIENSGHLDCIVIRSTTHQYFVSQITRLA